MAILIDTLKTAGLSEQLSIIAVLISLGSLGLTIWATRISNRSLKHALMVYKRNEGKEFLKSYLELPDILEDTLNNLQEGAIDVVSLCEIIDAEPHAVHQHLVVKKNAIIKEMHSARERLSKLMALVPTYKELEKSKNHRKLIEYEKELHAFQKESEKYREKARQLKGDIQTQISEIKSKYD